MDRRPHWDDDLVNAVIDLQYHCVDCMEDDYPEIDPINHDAVNAAWAHEIIATVEDWHRDRWTGVCESPEEVVRELKQAQAAIQRVRGLHHFVVDEIETREGPEDVQHCSECGYIPTDEEPCPTLAALNTGT